MGAVPNYCDTYESNHEGANKSYSRPATGGEDIIRNVYGANTPEGEVGGLFRLKGQSDIAISKFVPLNFKFTKALDGDKGDIDPSTLLNKGTLKIRNDSKTDQTFQIIKTDDATGAVTVLSLGTIKPGEAFYYDFDYDGSNETLGVNGEGFWLSVVNKEIKGDDKAEDNIGDFNSEPSAADIQAIDDAKK